MTQCEGQQVSRRGQVSGRVPTAFEARNYRGTVHELTADMPWMRSRSPRTTSVPTPAERAASPRLDTGDINLGHELAPARSAPESDPVPFDAARGIF